MSVRRRLRKYIYYSNDRSLRRAWNRLRARTKKRILGIAVLSIVVIFAASSVYVYSTRNDYSQKPEITIKIGDYIQIGVYNSRPILWRCVDIDDNGPLMISDKILCLKPFDAAGSNTDGSHKRGFSSGSRRKTSGSNYWTDSNIRCWLNSEKDAGAVEWSCKNPPSAKNVTYNAYDAEAGFLNGFTQSDLRYIKSVSQKTIIDGYDHSSNNTIADNAYKYNNTISDIMQNYETALSEKVSDRIFLPDVKQLNTIYKNAEKLGEYYYVGIPTSEAVLNSDYTDAGLSERYRWYYWLRTPNATDQSSVFVKVMAPDGKETGSLEANDGRIGVRPAFYLKDTSLNITSGTGRDIDPYRLQKISD